ncbi:alkene reductase [Erythrobacter sp. SCSIO 43205]|uniref:alkene reductase n=1 Tax=Erythrobacter sp. SCSIO 43205 TaxID=2779361 RepID=UPI001CA8E989|nr:alkene reductase [Erythrobacter sp. SCSIO 43205]UAB77955.1 alkene reductase [Erythrobacter sp. SCSIO 43205]
MTDAPKHEALFQPLKMGALEARNRIFMAPLTRGRAADPMFVPNSMMETYYRQRSGAGMILTEATGISTEGLGWPSAPGIWSDEQTESWKPIVDAVHEEGGLISMQLWHMGRIVHPYFLDGKPPFSASETKAPGEAHTPEGKKEFVTARAMTHDDIKRTVDDYRRAAENAKKAGFDSVQLHGANGYLVDQFLRDGTNHRDDEYGGSPENRTRFMREALEAIVDVWGADRVGIRLSPNGDSQGTDDSNPPATFGAAAKVIEEMGLAYLELRQPGPDGTFGRTDVPKQDALIRELYSGALILNSDYTAQEADDDVSSGRCDAVSFGRPYISNPDLEKRIAAGAEFNPNKDVPKSWYFPTPEGYIDYLTLEEEKAAANAA